MPQQYLPHDLELIDSAIIQVNSGAGVGINFQFPPKISSDSRKGQWKEEPPNPNGAEPIAVYQGASSRQISLDWFYIVDGGEWTGASISRECRVLRGYM